MVFFTIEELDCIGAIKLERAVTDHTIRDLFMYADLTCMPIGKIYA